MSLYKINGSCIVSGIHIAKLCEYRGLNIYEVLGSGDLPYHVSASADLSSYETVSFDSKKYSHFGYRSQPAIEEVKQKIDEFIQNITEPHYVNQLDDDLNVEYWYWGPTILQFTKPDISIQCWMNDKFSKETFKGINVKVAYCKEQEPKLPIQKVVFSGYFIENGVEYPFRMEADKESRYYRIAVKSEEEEHIADEIAKQFPFYKSKPVAIQLKEHEV